MSPTNKSKISKVYKKINLLSSELLKQKKVLQKLKRKKNE
tara:strand:- start:157 stop:276 length:120 start_codon:yes stop_codon:yes gene_type:complete